MGIFDFLRGKGREVKRGGEADEIKSLINSRLGGRIANLNVSFADGTATLFGTASSHADREKAVLLAGNVSDVEKVDDRLVVRSETPQEQIAAQQAAQPTFVTVKAGDSLSKIAKEHYGDANKWQALFEANREVIEDPDLIYPGQVIRVPKEA